MESSRRNSYITSQLDSVNLRLESLFDEIGLSSSDREDRKKKVYSVVSDALENYVSQIKTERDDLKQQCEEKQQEILTMARTVPDVDLSQALGSFARSISQNRDQTNQSNNIVDMLNSDSIIQPPYQNIYSMLSEAGTKIKEIYEERATIASDLYTELEDLDKKLNGDLTSLKSDNVTNASLDSIKNEQALTEYTVTIPPSLIRPQSPKDTDLSLAHLTKLDTEIQRLRHHFQNRVARVSIVAAQIVAFWADLGTPQHEIDSNIMDHYKSDPEKIGTTPRDMVLVENMLKSLSSEKELRSERINTLSEDIYKLWEKLGEDEEYMQNFEHSNRGLGLGVLNAFEAEHARLIQKKKENVGVFIQDARSQLEQLWDKLYFSEQETYEFTPAWADIFTDASLEAHESEIGRLEKLLAERAPIITLIDQYRDLQNEEKELLASTQDASRLLGTRGAGNAAPKRDPSRLLREEQMRKRISKRKPKVMQELKAGLDEWFERVGEPFYIHGEDFSKILEEEIAKTAPASRYGKVRTPAPSSQTPATKASGTSGSSSSLNVRRAASTSGNPSSRAIPNTPVRPISQAANERSSPTKPSSPLKSKINLSNSPSSNLNAFPSSSPIRPPFGRSSSPSKPSAFGSRTNSQQSTVSPIKSQTGRSSPTRNGPTSGRSSPCRQPFGRSASPTRPPQNQLSSPLRQASPTRGPISRSATSLGMRSNPNSTISNPPTLSHPARPKSVHGHRTTTSVSSIPNLGFPTKADTSTPSGTLASPSRVPSNPSPSKFTLGHNRSRSVIENKSQFAMFGQANSRPGQNPQTPKTPPKGNAYGGGMARVNEYSVGSLDSPTSHSMMLMQGGRDNMNGRGPISLSASPPKKPQYHNAQNLRYDFPNLNSDGLGDVAMEDVDHQDMTARSPNRTFSSGSATMYNIQLSPERQSQKQLKEIQYMQKSQRALQRLHAEAMAKAQQGNSSFDEQTFGSPHFNPFFNGVNGGGAGGEYATGSGNNDTNGNGFGGSLMNNSMVMPNGNSTPLYPGGLAGENQMFFPPPNGKHMMSNGEGIRRPSFQSDSGLRPSASFSSEEQRGQNPMLEGQGVLRESSHSHNSPRQNQQSHGHFNNPSSPILNHSNPTYMTGSHNLSHNESHGKSPNQNPNNELANISQDPSLGPISNSNFGDDMYQQWRRHALRQLDHNGTMQGPVHSTDNIVVEHPSPIAATVNGTSIDPEGLGKGQREANRNRDTDMTDEGDAKISPLRSQQQNPQGATGRSRKERLSEFNWEKDTF